VNGYPDQNNQNPDRKKHGLQKILEQRGNKVLGSDWPKGDIANNKRHRKGQINNG
jgi:hypothetical protein